MATEARELRNMGLGFQMVQGMVNDNYPMASKHRELANHYARMGFESSAAHGKDSLRKAAIEDCLVRIKNSK